jgi:hypothetical protein
MWRSVLNRSAGGIGLLVVAVFGVASIIALLLAIGWALTVNTNLLGK